MTQKSKSELIPDQIRATVVGNKTVAEWDRLWEPLPYAFSRDHPELRHVIGLFRILIDGEVKYIARAIEPKGGIAKGLKRIAGPDQTGNSGYGAQKIRQNIDQVKVEILRVENTNNPSKSAADLKKYFNRIYDPIWGIPFKRRMKMIRLGAIPPS